MIENKIKYCECGCGQIVNKRFVKGHSSRMPGVGEKISESKKGHIVTKETRLKISEKSKNPSQETRKKISEAQIGRPRSEETKLKISNSHKGKKKSKESIEKRTESRKDFKHSEESKTKMSLSHMGKTIPDKTRKAISERHSGNKNFFWSGGISFEPYTPEFNKALKRQIRERDNFTCQHPDCEIKSKSLHCHHIDYLKQNSISENLISLCEKHHGKTNAGDREFWHFFYSEIMDIKSMNLKNRIKPVIIQ